MTKNQSGSKAAHAAISFFLPQAATESQAALKAQQGDAMAMLETQVGYDHMMAACRSFLGF